MRPFDLRGVAAARELVDGMAMVFPALVVVVA
jgi:hypothetical protein